MLPRTLEPEMSESMEEAEEYDTIDHSAVNQKFAEDFLSAIQSKPVEMRDCLDLGTGTALIPVEICKRNRALRIMATDASIAMLEFAKYRIEVASMLERIQLHRGDAKRLVFDDCNFDFVISNSLLHHIPDPAVVLREAWRVLRPGGLLFLRDLLRPDTNESVESLVTKHASNESAVGQQLLRQSLHAALSLAELGEMLGAIGIPPQTIEVSSDRHWTVSAWKE